MRKLMLKLAGSTPTRKTVKFLRLHLLANWWLHQFPVVKTLPESGVRFRARRVESLALSVEMFDNDSLYPGTIPTDTRTFADLGCNVGYFTCRLCHTLKTTQLKGLMVDANADAVEDAQWHVQANRLQDVHVLRGLAGQGVQKDEADFYLHTSNVCSTSAPPDTGANRSADWTHIKVPALCIEANWSKYFGNTPCDLLKMDIEGSEMDFFRNETAFLERVKTVLIEWHKQRVTFSEVEKNLTGHGFSLKAILHEDEAAGTAVFSKQSR